ncbi:hypothetical protein ACLB2K_076897 [Fragaria x ananassa]
MLLKIEQACVGVFRTKVDEAEQCKAQLQQAIANCKAEFVDICAALGEKPPLFDPKTGGSLKKELEIIIPQLEVMKKQKIERKDQIFSVLDQLQKLSKEISRIMENEIFFLIVFLNISFVPASNFGKCPVGDVESDGYTLRRAKEIQNVTSCLAVSESDITEPNILSVDLLNDVEAEG